MRDCLVGFAVLAATSFAAAQSNVRGWYTQGQVWVVWQAAGAPPTTYEIHRGASPFTSTAGATLAGRPFRGEWRADRLKQLEPSATWRIPLPGGGHYTLQDNEGLFVFTPHAPGAEHFAVTQPGATLVSAANRTAAPVVYGYDPVGDPVRPHLQLEGETPEGWSVAAYALFADGRDDPDDARPDYFVGANAAKNGAPSVFGVFAPPQGLPAAGRYPMAIGLHGGGGNFVNVRPGGKQWANIDTRLSAGLVVTMDDALYRLARNGLPSDAVTFWFGYAAATDPFVTPPPLPPAGSLVVPYTLRRLQWVRDWLLSDNSGYRVDPARVTVMGHSMGAQGSIMLARLEPSRFAAAVAYTPGLDGPDGSSAEQLLGTRALNLRTTLRGLDGNPAATVGIAEVWAPARRISLDRDMPLIRIYLGKNDPIAEWNADKVEQYAAIDAAAWGMHLFWDERSHSPPTWSTGPLGQWISPAMTQRATAESLTRYIADESFPGFFADDQNPLAGRQPDPGNGAPTSGVPWGTWSGYLDWDQRGLLDTTSGWSCTLFATGLSPSAVDNAPFTETAVRLAIRKPRRFRPPPGTTVQYVARDSSTNAVVAHGTVVAGAEGDGDVVRLPALPVPRDPRRIRVEVWTGPAPGGDLTADGSVTVDDLLPAAAAGSAPDLDGDGQANASDTARLELVVREHELGRMARR